ncbi:hypothetical protein ACXATD_000596 [Clostridium sporogenes]
MAGIAKPNIEKLGKEAKYKVISIKASSGSGGTLEKCGLFDGITSNAWNTPEVFYWNEDYDYHLEIDILSDNINIWRSGTANFSSYCNPLIIYKWDENDYVDVSNLYKQTTSAIKNGEWEKTIYDLPKGRYKFTNNKKLRLDSEWYIEEIKNNKYLLKQNNNYYSINNNYIDLGKINNSEDLNTIIDEHGHNDLSIITKELNTKKIPVKLENDYYKSFDINLNDIKDSINLIEEDDKKYIEYGCNNYKISDKVKEINNAKFKVLMKE